MTEKNKLIIAAAGSGKTTEIINKAIENKVDKILITTYTTDNANELKKNMIKKVGCIPSNIVIQTWFSFLLKHGVKPFQHCITDKKINGMRLVNTASGMKTSKISYPENDVDKYYFDKRYNIYSDKISKFCIRCDENNDGAVIDRISRIYSHIFIDEVQDLAGYDLEIIKLLMLSRSKITLVGDPRQVTYLTHNPKKYKQYSNGMIENFILEKCKKCNCEVDKISLNKSHRNNEYICKYSSRLYHELEEPVSNQKVKTTHDGIFIVKKKDVNKYLKEYNPVQLRWNSKITVNKDYIFMNMGESKGLTFDRVLIYPTSEMKKWIEDNSYKLKDTSKAKFYVALTRAKYSVGIVFDDKKELVFDESVKPYEL